MPFRLVVEISDADLDYYRKVLDETAERAANVDERELLQSAHNMLEKAHAAGLTGSVKKRIEDLGMLLAMLEDREWTLDAEDRERIVTVLRYFADVLDVIPDEMPGLGYVDDALMTELILRELRDDLEAYRDFCAYRTRQEQSRGKRAHVGREDWIAAKRRQVFARMKRRRAERHRHGSSKPPTPAILAYRY